MVATPDVVAVTCEDRIVATHARHWGSGATITDPDHVATAKELRARSMRRVLLRRHVRPAAPTATGIAVALRALPDYDDLFGVDFHHAPDLQGVHTS